MTFRDKLYIIKCNFIEYWLKGEKFLDFRTKYPRPLDAKSIKKILYANEKNIFLEIGMGKGEDTFDFLNSIPNIKLYGFEPDKQNYNDIIAQNNSPNLTVYNKAVGKEKGTLTFYPSTQESGGLSGSLKKPTGHLGKYTHVKFDDAILVDVITLDQWTKENEITKIDFIWMDVQGAEADVLLGGIEILKNTSYIWTEYSDENLYENQASLDDLCKILPNFEMVFIANTDVLFRNKHLK